MLPADIRTPESVEDMRAAVRQATEDGCEYLAVVGGDGTLNLVVDELVTIGSEPGPVLALIPSGSGSDFNRMFALSKSIEGAVAHLEVGIVFSFVARGGSFGVDLFGGVLFWS